MTKIALIVIVLFLVGGGIFGYVYFNKPKPVQKPVPVAQRDVDFGPYMADLQRKIKSAWYPPKGNESKSIQVIFKVHSDGSMSDLRLSKASGMKLADDAALKAISNAAPFRKLPDGSPPDVDIQFTFDYNVFKGGPRDKEEADAFSSSSSAEEDKLSKKGFPAQKKEFVRDFEGK